MPGLYTGRTRHVHVKAQAPDHPPLTTQLYFPGEAGNNRDSLFAKALLLDLNDKDATFTFVLRTSQEQDSVATESETGPPRLRSR